MSIWFFLWLFLSGALLFFLGWTLYILFQQKRTWKEFAAKRKLRYRSANLLASPEMSGAVDNYSFSFFIGEHLGLDARSSRKLSAIEVQLTSKMPFQSGVASGGMVPIIHAMRLKEEIQPNHPKWDKNYIAAASSRNALESYLTNERLDALLSLMKIKNAWVVLVSQGDMMLLRFDTPDALDTQDKLSRITQKMVEVARVLELKAGEDGRLKADMQRKPVKEVSIKIDEDKIAEASAFQLEDEKKNP